MRSTGSGAFGLAVIRERVDRLCLDASDAEFHSIEESNSHAAWRARTYAVRFLADSRVCEWLAEVNATKGVAPSSADVHSRFAFEVNRILHGRLECELVATPFLSLAQRSWAIRWRLRWKVTRACIKQREELPLYETQQEAQALGTRSRHFNHSILADLGAEKATPYTPGTDPC